MIRQSASAVISSAISMTLVFVLLIVASDAAWRIYSTITPVGEWLQIEAIEVADSIDGACPKMMVQRSIHKPFEGKWRVEAEKKVGGLYVFRRIAIGENSYTPDAKLPANLDLGWWTLDGFCKEINGGYRVALDKGVYRINTTWIIEPEHFPPKRLSINSNDFEIR